jgi:uncharacterized protein
METLIGFSVGLTIGATGIGGGTLMLPALVLALGFPVRAGVATALVFSSIVKLLTSGVYLWRREADLRILGYLLAGGAPGAILGAMLLQGLRSNRSDGWVLAIVGLTVVFSATVSFVRLRAAKPVAAAWRSLLLCAFPIGFGTAFSSAGAGSMGAIALFNLTKLSPARVVGTNLIFGLIVSVLAGGIHAAAGSCVWPAVIKMAPAGVLGAITGAHVSWGMKEKTLRSLVLACVAFAGVLIFKKGVSAIF